MKSRTQRLRLTECITSWFRKTLKSVQTYYALRFHKPTLKTLATTLNSHILQRNMTSPPITHSSVARCTTFALQHSQTILSRSKMIQVSEPQLKESLRHHMNSMTLQPNPAALRLIKMDMADGEPRTII